jgi:hypothetical protein
MVLNYFTEIAFKRKNLWDAGKTKKGVPGLRKNQAKRDFLSMGPWGITFSVLPSLGPADFFF